MHKGILMIAFLAAGLAGSAAAQCPPKTVVSDTLLNADGSPASGRVVIAWPTFQAGTCQVISGQVSVTVVAGVFSAELYANDAAVPESTSYRVTYYLKSGRITTEYWVVPSSAAPVSLATVRSPSVPVPNVMFSQAQVTNLVSDLSRKVELPAACPAGKFLQANGSTVPPQVACVDGTGAPLASSTASGTVKTDVTEADPRVYTKTSADSLLAGKADTIHTHAAAEITSGILDPARLPNPAAAALGGVKSATCAGTDKVTGISTSGAVTCAPDQTGGGGSSSQHQANGANLAANDPVNFQDTATIAVTNPSAGTIAVGVKDGSITAPKLSVVNPTNSQLSGLGDANIVTAALSADRINGTAEVLSSKGTANGYPALNASSKVIQDPASAQVAPAPDKIPLADGAGKVDNGWLTSGVSLLGQSIGAAEIEDGAVSAAKLSVANPTNAQLGGIGDSNIAAGALSPDRIAGTATTLTDRFGSAPGSRIATTSLAGDPTANNCAKWATGGKLDDAGAPCGSGSGDSTKTHYIPVTCDTPRTQTLAGNSFWTVAALTEWDFGHWEFVKDVDGKIYCHAIIPNPLAATPAGAVILEVTANATSGVTRFSIRSFVAGDGDTLNPASGSWTSAPAQDVTVPATARNLKRVTFAALPALSAAKVFVVEIFHEGAHPNDTLATNTELFKIYLRVDLTQ